MKTVLVVDDDYSILDAVRRILTEAGYMVKIVSEGKTVQEAAEKDHPDLILLDIRMAKPNGEAVVRKLRSFINTKHIPVVFMSARENLDQITKTIGVEDFIKKPFDIDHLVKKVKKNIKSG